MTDLQRGMRDATKLDSVRETHQGWKAYPKTGGERWIVEPITPDYLRGFMAAGGFVDCESKYPARAAA